jgi:hypothetical protein
MKERFNTIMNGVNLGVLAPFIGVLFLYGVDMFLSGYQPLERFVDSNTTIEKLPKLLALSVFIGSLPIFFIVLNQKMSKLAKGMIYATFLYGFVIIALKVTELIIL